MTPIEIHRASRPGYPAMAVHRFTIGSESPHWSRGYDVAECGPYRATSLKSSAAHKLARIMVAAGEPDGPIEAFRDGKLCYRVASLYAFGKRTLLEDPRLHLRRHQERVFPAVHSGVSAGSEDVPAISGRETVAEAV